MGRVLRHVALIDSAVHAFVFSSVEHVPKARSLVYLSQPQLLEALPQGQQAQVDLVNVAAIDAYYAENPEKARHRSPAHACEHCRKHVTAPTWRLEHLHRYVAPPWPISSLVFIYPRKFVPCARSPPCCAARLYPPLVQGVGVPWQGHRMSCLSPSPFTLPFPLHEPTLTLLYVCSSSCCAVRAHQRLHPRRRPSRHLPCRHILTRATRIVTIPGM
jgi:hypothetical protein